MGKGLDSRNNSIFSFKLRVTIEINVVCTSTIATVGAITIAITRTTMEVTFNTTMENAYEINFIVSYLTSGQIR